MQITAHHLSPADALRAFTEHGSASAAELERARKVGDVVVAAASCEWLQRSCALRRANRRAPDTTPRVASTCGCAFTRAAPLTAHSAASSNWPRRTSAIARVLNIPNSSGSNGLRCARVVGRRDRGVRVARLRVHERQRVMAHREIRAQVDGALVFANGLVEAPAQPQRAAHRPMRGRVAIVHHQALPAASYARSLSRSRSTQRLKSVLEMRERQSRVGARKRRIELHRHFEEVHRALVVGFGEAIHVPQARGGGPPTRRANSAASESRGCVPSFRFRSRSTRRSGCRFRRAPRTHRPVACRNSSAQTIRAVRVSASSTETTSRAASRRTEPLTT